VSATDTPSIQLRAESLTKRFGLRAVFSNLTFSVTTGDALAVTGHNGSGKSTLLKILANVTERSEGKVMWSLNGSDVSDEALPRHIGFAAPYLQLYDEFTAWEHIGLLENLRGAEVDKQRAESLLERFGLADRRHDQIKTFSSGMTQRMKLITALVHRPAFLFLDEPRTNLDEAGIAVVEQLVTEERDSRITLVATNDPDDLKMCTLKISVANNR
jgi:heme exporter protein A